MHYVYYEVHCHMKFVESDNAHSLYVSDFASDFQVRCLSSFQCGIRPIIKIIRPWSRRLRKLPGEFS